MYPRNVLFVILTFAAGLGQPISARAPNQPDVRLQQVFAPYWTVEPGWESQFQLLNNLPDSSLTVTPTLRLSNGHELLLTPVTIDPKDVITLNVANELQRVSGRLAEHAAAYGSVIFKFDAVSNRVLFATVAVRKVAEPIGYDFDAYGSDEADDSPTREGIWWLPGISRTEYLVVANASDQSNRGRLFLFNASGKEWHRDLELGSRETIRLAVRDLVKTSGLTGTFGGMTLQIAERSNSVDVEHFVYDESSGFSELMKMVDHDPAATLSERVSGGNTVWTTWAPMLALQTPDPALAVPTGTKLQPQILIRNTTAKLQTANIKLNWRSASGKGSAPPSPIQLKAFETRLIDVAALQKARQVPLDARWALVEISSPTAKPDDLMAIASSYDSTGSYGAGTQFSDQLGNHWVSAQFSVDETHNSLITVTNGGKQQADAKITFHFDHARHHYEVLQTIAPGDQLWLNLREIIRSSQPDRNGESFPANVRSVTLDIEQIKGAGNPSLMEGDIVVP